MEKYLKGYCVIAETSGKVFVERQSGRGYGRTNIRLVDDRWNIKVYPDKETAQDDLDEYLEYHPKAIKENLKIKYIEAEMNFNINLMHD